MKEQSLKQKIVTASKWSALAEISSRAISPLIFVILARLLTPDDYGVVTVAAMVISFSQLFWDAGLSKSLIQREDDIDRISNIVFWTNLFLAVTIYGIIFSFSGFIANFFSIKQVAAVIKVQGLQIIISSLFSVQTARFQRNLNFKTLFWVRLLTTLTPGLASIPLAWMGYGYWALVTGTLVGALAQLIMLWKLSPWRPAFEYDMNIARGLYPFGLWVTGEGLMSWLTTWLDSIVLGKFLGSYNLGLYRTGNNFVMLIFGLLLSPLLPVLFSSLSRMQSNLELFRNSLTKATKLVTMVALPIGVGIFLTSGPLSLIVFGVKWQGVDKVIGIMALTHGISWIVGANSEAYRAIGRPDLSMKIMMLGLFLYFPSYILAAPHGLNTFLWVRMSLAMVMLPVHVFVANKYIDLSPVHLFKNLKWIFVAVIMMTVATVAADLLIYDQWKAFVAMVLTGMVIYLLFLLPEHYFLKSVFSLVLKRNA